MIWEVENILLRSNRPGYPGTEVSPSEILEWVRHIKRLGVKSIICLLDEEHMKMYNMNTSLVNFYKVHGLKAAHIRTTDGVTPNWVVRSLALEAFIELPKPVLIHCSSGIERSAIAAEHIINHLDWKEFYKKLVA